MRVASYNTGDYTGKGFARGSKEGIEAIRASMAAVGAELWALQEDVCCYGNKVGAYPYGILYSDYTNYERVGSHRYNYKAFLSNLEIREVKRVFYVGDRVFNHPWFLSGVARISGKDVTLISLHLDWQDKATRLEQINQIIAYAKDAEYAMIMGDFNPCNYENGVKISEVATHEVDYKYFADAGFNLANCGRFGVFHTYLDTTSMPAPLDNIITTPNITIENAGIQADKWMYDHVILWADVTVN